MEDEHYYDRPSRNEQLGSIGRNAGAFILAGLLGGILGLASSLSSTYLYLTMWPFGPNPYTAIIRVLADTMSIIRTLSVILLILGVYGLSIQYKAPVLILVATLDAVVLLMIEIGDAYLAATGDIAARVTIGWGTVVVGAIASIIFGITILGLRNRSSQPGVFTVFGLVEMMWPIAYILVTIAYVSIAYFVSQAFAILIGALLAVLYWNEHRREPLVYDDTSDFSQSSQVWD